MPFHELVEQLVAEHDREVVDLEQQIRFLKCQDEGEQFLASGCFRVNSSRSILEDEALTSAGETAFAAKRRPKSPMLDEYPPLEERLGGVEVPAGQMARRPVVRTLLEDDPLAVESVCATNGTPGSDVLDPARRGMLMFTLTSQDASLFLRTFVNVWARYTRYARTCVALRVRATWMDSVHDAGDLVNSIMVANLTAPKDGAKKGEFKWNFNCRDHGCIVHPNSTTRITWDMTGIALLMFDVITIPLQAFDLPPNDFLRFMEWFTLMFWTLDMVGSCVTGYVHEGFTEMKLRRIMINYVKTWLLLDLIVVGPDWFFLIMYGLSGEKESNMNTSGSKLFKIVRAIRCTRLLRIAKLQRLVAMVRDRIRSEVAFIMLNVVKLISLLLLVNHFVAAVWYVIGTLTKSLGMENWIDSDQGFADASLGYRYTTALHWSLTQFTPASMSVQPQNITERIFAITVLVFGLVLFSSFISTITTSMTQLGKMADDRSKQFWLLRRYLRQHEVPNALTYRVLRYVDYAARDEDVIISESRITVLNLLSDQLRNELKYYVSFSAMSTHPLFAKAEDVSKAGMNQLAGEALSMKVLAMGDVLFGKGTVASHMYIIVSGELAYAKSEWDVADFVQVRQEDWLSEPALWTECWMHAGSALGSSDCKILCIDLDSFGQVIRRDVPIYSLMSHYARMFLAWLNCQTRGEVTDIHPACSMRPIVNQLMNMEENVPWVDWSSPDAFRRAAVTSRRPSMRSSTSGRDSFGSLGMSLGIA